MQFNLVYWHVYQALQAYESIQQGEGYGYVEGWDI